MPISQDELGRRIARAREQRGLTQAQLAEALGLSQSAVSRIESGERGVDSLELAAIAERLGVSVLDLLEEAPLPDELVALAARVAAARDPGAVDRARRRAADLVRFHRLLERLGVPDRRRLGLPSLAVPRRGRAIDQGAKLAHRARDLLGFGAEPLPDLVALVEDRLGIDVAVEPLPEGVEGLSLRLEDFALVLVRSQPVLGRERFTLAHEVGHLLAGDAQPVYLDEDLVGRELPEVRANAFATHFLMPPDGIERRLGGRPIDGQVACELQDAFGVSLEALLWHLRNLGLLTEAQQEQLQAAGPKALALRHGYLAEWRASYRSEPVRHPPARLFRRGMEAYSQGLIGAERLASLLGIEDVEGFRRELEEAGIAPAAWPEDTAPA